MLESSTKSASTPVLILVSLLLLLLLIILRRCLFSIVRREMLRICFLSAIYLLECTCLCNVIQNSIFGWRSSFTKNHRRFENILKLIEQTKILAFLCHPFIRNDLVQKEQFKKKKKMSVSATPAREKARPVR